MIVAIDGPVGSGKSAVGRRVAAELGLPFVDSGLMYRAIAVLARRAGIDAVNSEALEEVARRTPITIREGSVRAGDEELGDSLVDPSINDILPVVSSLAGVRQALVDRQRRLACPDVVMAGRDIGTVVFPDADLKVYLTASVEERVRRRAEQFRRRGADVETEALRREVVERDRAVIASAG